MLLRLNLYVEVYPSNITLLKVDTRANFEITLLFVVWNYFVQMKLSCP